MYIRPWPTFGSICNVIVSVQNSGKVASSQAGPLSAGHGVMLLCRGLRRLWPLVSGAHHVITNLSPASAESGDWCTEWKASSHSELIRLYGTSELVIPSLWIECKPINDSQQSELNVNNTLSINCRSESNGASHLRSELQDISLKIETRLRGLWRFTETEDTG